MSDPQGFINDLSPGKVFLVGFGRDAFRKDDESPGKALHSFHVRADSISLACDELDFAFFYPLSPVDLSQQKPSDHLGYFSFRHSKDDASVISEEWFSNHDHYLLAFQSDELLEKVRALNLFDGVLGFRKKSSEWHDLLKDFGLGLEECFSSCSGKSAKGRLNRSEKSLFALKLLTKLNPLDLGVDAPFSFLALTRGERVAFHGTSPGEGMFDDWTYYQTKTTLAEFESVGWLQLENRHNSDSKEMNLGKRVRLLPKFFIEFLGLDDFPEDFHSRLPDGKLEEVSNAYFDDLKYLRDLRKSLEKERASHKATIRSSGKGSPKYLVSEKAVEHLARIFHKQAVACHF